MTVELELYDRMELDEFYEEDQFVADLFGVYANRRDRGKPPHLLHLLWCAEQHGPDARRKLRTVVGLYEAARTYRQTAHLPQR